MNLWDFFFGTRALQVKVRSDSRSFRSCANFDIGTGKIDSLKVKSKTGNCSGGTEIWTNSCWLKNKLIWN